jgi:hypothetical protein
MTTTANHTKIYLGLFLLSVLMLATDSKIIPGGPFVSVHGEILPAVSCLAMLFLVVRDFRTATTARRIGLSFLAFVSVSIIFLVVFIVVSFCRERFARGALFGW